MLLINRLVCPYIMYKLLCRKLLPWFQKLYHSAFSVSILYRNNKFKVFNQ